MTRIEQHAQPASLAVIIPTFKRDWSLGRLLKAVMAQTLRDLEVIIVDQNPLGFLESRLSPGDLKQARLVRLDQPNLSTARNIGYLHSSAPFILFIDDDLIPAPDFCARLLDEFRLQPDIRCLVPVVRDLSRDPFLVMADYEQQRTEFGRDKRLWRLRQAIGAAMAFRRDGFEEVGGFDELAFEFARAGEDYEFFSRMNSRQLPFWLVTDLEVDHDDRTPGGVEMRTITKDANRARSIRTLVYKACRWSGSAERLAWTETCRLIRSVVLNRGALRRSAREIAGDIRTALDALAELRELEHRTAGVFQPIDKVNYLHGQRKAV